VHLLPDRVRALVPIKPAAIGLHATKPETKERIADLPEPTPATSARYDGRSLLHIAKGLEPLEHGGDVGTRKLQPAGDLRVARSPGGDRGQDTEVAPGVADAALLPDQRERLIVQRRSGRWISLQAKKSSAMSQELKLSGGAPGSNCAASAANAASCTERGASS